MSYPHGGAAQIFRDFVVVGSPGSGVHQPVKGQVRDWGAEIETALAALAAEAPAQAASVAAVEAKLSAMRGETLDPAAAAAANDSAFAVLGSAYPGAIVDLRGRTIPVTAIPVTVRCVNGWFRRTNLDEAAPIDLPAFGTLDWRETILDGGRIVVGWPQDTAHAYNGLALTGYMASNAGHATGLLDWSIAWSRDQWAGATRIEQGVTFGLSGAVSVFGAAIHPPASDAASPFQMALVMDDTGSGVFARLYARRLASSVLGSAGGGPVAAEGAWAETLFGGLTFGSALRAACDAQFSVTTGGVPTLVHSMGLHGVDPHNGSFYAGFHGLSPLVGPHLVYVTNTPSDGTANITWVANIGGLTQGVEPSVAWFKNGVSSRACGFVRSQSGTYPMRFWSTASVPSQASVTGAAVQDCPWGGNFATFSPIPCRMRPRRKGGLVGWIASDATLEGNETDELHFAFTGRRVRDGGAGPVGLYWGRVTRGSGNFDNMWSRAKITKLGDLYFANSNAVDTSNQVGVPSLCFSDANTLHIFATDENPAIGNDYDESFMRIITIRLHDAYSDAAERAGYDDGVGRAKNVQRVDEFVEH